MKHFLLFIALISSSYVKSQCFEIESILVDACGNPEGENEMVRFKVGNTALNTANLSVVWASPASTNPWRGVCRDASTASKIALLNAGIINCGFLKEPVAGVLPANAKVLLITSTNFNTTFNSFANLSDTLYVIFQCSGTTSGHFANHTGSGIRNFSMSFSLPASCSDAVSYDCSLLSQGISGYDGGTVEYTPSGVASYVNNGCQAPFVPLSVDAGANGTTCVNSTQNFTATTSGAYTSVVWSTGAGATGSFAPTNSLSTTYTPGAGDNGTIKLYFTAIKSCGTQTTTTKDSVNLTVTPLPTVTVSPGSVNICVGQTAVVQANTNTAVTYTWSTGVNTNTASLNAVGIYTVHVSNACGSNSSTVSVSLLSAPSISVASSASSICASGQTATLSLSGSTGTYTWSNGANTATASITAPGVYTATVTTTSCGSATTSVSVGTMPLPVISISSPTNTICSGSSVVLTANSSTGTYLWTGGATTQTVSVGTQSIVVTTTNACGTAMATQTLNIIPLPSLSVTPNSAVLCGGQSTTLQANTNTAVTYTWSTGVNTNTATVSAAGIYTVTASNQCGSAAATSTITVGSSAPSITVVSTSTLLCPGQTATLSLTGSTGTYMWSTGATTPTITVSNFGVYSATVTNSCGQGPSLITITSSPNPTVQISPSSTTLCNGSTATLTAIGSVSNYTWSTGATSNAIQVNTPGVVTVSVSNSCGMASDAVTITSSTVPVLILNANASLICPYQTATLTVTGGNAPYTWSNSSATGSVVTTTGGTVTVSNTNGCGTNTASFVVTVDHVYAGFTANPLTGVKPLVVNFTNTSVHADGYLWDFGNGHTSNNVSAQTYTAAGDYTVTLKATDGACIDSVSLIIKVLNEDPGLIIPNVFTPNNDLANDIFKITAGNMTEFNCVIFDRWGLKLFSWNDINEGWDGTNNGKQCAAGTYFYLITAKDASDKAINKQGTVSLFR